MAKKRRPRRSLYRRSAKSLVYYRIAQTARRGSHRGLPDVFVVTALLMPPPVGWRPGDPMPVAEDTGDNSIGFLVERTGRDLRVMHVEDPNKIGHHHELGEGAIDWVRRSVPELQSGGRSSNNGSLLNGVWG